MAAISCGLSGLPIKIVSQNARSTSSPAAISLSSPAESINRRSLLLATGGLAPGLLLSHSANADEIPDRYKAFVDPIDGYSYLYPSDWRDFEFTGCDSAFKDRNVALQHVRVSFVPTEKQAISDLGPIDEVVPSLVKTVYAAPTQKPTILDMQEREIGGKKYWTFEYSLRTPNFGRTAFATLAIGNGRYYTLVVGANERRWRRVRDRLRTVADSFRLVDI